MAAHFTTDAAEALAATEGLLARDPVANNVVLGLLHGARTFARPAPMWWVSDDRGRPTATLVGPGTVLPAILGPADAHDASELARASASSPQPVRLVNGPAAASAAFAGAFATATGQPARPLAGERIYEATSIIAAAHVAGARRLATGADLDLLTEHFGTFGAETGTGHGTPAEDRERVEGFIATNKLHVWVVDGEVVATTIVIPPCHGVSRIGYVFTPAAQRGRGYASRLVYELTEQILGAGQRAILYTQLENPISNRVYQRLGYVPVSEQVRYGFGDADQR